MRHFTFVPLMLLASLTQAQIASTFDADADGWTCSDNNLAGPLTVNHNATGGNPGGNISAGTTSSQPYFFTTPAKFGGNIAYFSYGQDLTFDLQVDHVASVHGAAGDLQIRSPSGSILVLNLATFPAQAPAWSTFTVRLDETAGWRVGGVGGPLATKAQMIQYLSGVSSIRINIKYNSGATAFTGAIDNVILNQRAISAAPSVSSFTPANGKPGTSITISGSDFDPVASNNEVFFGAQAGVITSASATSLTVTVPPGAAYGHMNVINKTTGLSKLSAEPFVPTFDGGGRIIPASLASKFDIPLTGGYGGAAIADMDRDGWNDLVVARGDNTGIWVYRNLGAGGDLTAASFAAPVNYPTLLSGTNGSGLATIDFDNDGKLDMVTSGWTGGPGAFATFRNTSTPGSLSFEAVEHWNGRSDESPVYTAADIDGDGLPELISGEGSGGAGQNVWITQNFSTPGNIEFGYSILYFPSTLDDAASGATIADLDNDGKPEFILVHNFGGAFSVIPNTSTPGTISFATASAFTVTTAIRGSINVADLNLDGKNDLAWKNGFSNDDIHIRINTNSGGALAMSDFATEIILNGDVTNYGALSLADINGDGRIDMLATDNGDVGIFENVYSGGTFDVTAFVPGYRYQGSGVSTYPSGALAGDLNGDNKPDIVAGITNTSPNRISIYENKNLHAPVISLNTVSPLQGPVGSTVTITGDHFSTTPDENKVHFGAALATVLTATNTQLTVTVPAGAGYAPVRVTRDQFTASYHLPFSPTFSSGVSFDATHFAAPVSFTLTAGDYDIDAGDLNDDGKPDILAEANTNKVYAFRNTHSTGAITSSSLLADDSITATVTQNPRIIDLNGDSKPDFVATNGVFRNISSGSEINFEVQTAVGGILTAYPADFNHDGKTDYVGSDGGSLNVSVFENRMRQGTGAFISGGNYNSISTGIDFAKPAIGGGPVAADFDNDGFTDMASGNGTTDNVTVWRNTGTYRLGAASFVSVGNLAAGDNPGRLYTGDLDVDGKMDILLYHGAGTSSTLISAFHNTGSVGSISFNRVDYTLPSAGTLAWISDLDGDGRPEILVTSETTNQFFILKNTSTAGILDASSFASPFSTAVTGPRGLTTADINLDGKPEIIVNTNSNTLLVYENLVPAVSISFTLQPADEEVCAGGTTTFSLVASGDTNLQYQWQIDNTGFVDLANNSTYSGVTTSTLTITPAVALDGSVYRCLVRGDNSVDTPSAPVTLTVNSIPVAPTIATTDAGCGPASTILTPTGAAAGEEYRFYDAATAGSLLASGAAFTTPSLAVSTTYHISTYNTTTLCESARVPATVNVQTCNSPVIAPSTSSALIDGVVTIDLEELITDADDNLDPATLQIISQPASGAPAVLNGFILTIDYSGIPFTGTDDVEIKICDLTAICTQQNLTIELLGEIEVFNGLSPNNDGQNDFFFIQYIDLFPDTEKNHVTIYNRWGDVVYEIGDYNNADRAFKGLSDKGKELPSGTYFYKIEFASGHASKTGYLILKR
jgi:gliding motility-associated-like protein